MLVYNIITNTIKLSCSKGVYDETKTLPKWKSHRTAPKLKPAKLERRERRPSNDAADVHRAYTGMDREIVEEFISVTMDPKHYS